MNKLNEFLAVEVMGWIRKKGRSDTYGPILHSHYIDPTNCDFWLDAHGWNPSENIEQAMMCLSEASHWRAEWAGGDYFVTVEMLQDWGEVEERADTLPYAISLACAKARGYTDE